MPGFFASTTALTICAVGNTEGGFSLDALRANAFTPNIDADGKRFGWVSMDDFLDTDGFALASLDTRFAGFSYRMDVRKVSGAVVRLHLAEAVREAEAAGTRLSSAKKKVLKEEITERLMAQAEFSPSVVNCIWEEEKKRLLLATQSEQMIWAVLDLFERSFSLDSTQLTPKVDPAAFFAKILQEGRYNCANGVVLEPMGSASLAKDNESEKTAVDVQNSMESVTQALEEGFRVHKIHLICTDDADPDWQADFTIDTSFVATGIRLPKAPKNVDKDATFLLRAEFCSKIADTLQTICALEDL